MTEHHLIADFEALRTTLGLDSWSILGHSYGGRRRSGTPMHPETVDKVIHAVAAADYTRLVTGFVLG